MKHDTEFAWGLDAGIKSLDNGAEVAEGEVLFADRQGDKRLMQELNAYAQNTSGVRLDVASVAPELAGHDREDRRKHIMES